MALDHRQSPFPKRPNDLDTHRARVAVTTVAFLVASGAIILTVPALAVTTCTYDPATETISLTTDQFESASVAVEGDGANLDPMAPDGAILFSTVGSPWVACGSATNANTMSIVVLGSASFGQTFTLDNLIGDQFSTSIEWAIELRSGSGSYDTLFINASEDKNDTITLTDSSFALNGGVGQILGLEIYRVSGNAGADTIDGSALISVQLQGWGNEGADWIAPGLASLYPNSDFLVGGTGVDTLTYASRTTSTVIDNTNHTAGHTANADCDVLDPGDERDRQHQFEISEGGSASDCLVGAAGVDETFIPGDGDDDITGNGGDEDFLDWSSSSSAMVMDPGSGAATGQGADTFTNILRYIGSSFDDVLVWDGTTVAFSGRSGEDTVDATAQTANQVINLYLLGTPPGDLENLLGGFGDDRLIGNDIGNRINGNAGKDYVNGRALSDNIEGRGGADALFGGRGDDDLFGNAGNDRLIGGPNFDTANGGRGSDSCDAEEQVSC